jgi:hypothetical protein
MPEQTRGQVNVFLEKLERSIGSKVAAHVRRLEQMVLGSSLPSGILTHLLAAKFARSGSPAVAAAQPTAELVRRSA